MTSQSSVEAARRRLRDLIRRGEKLGLTRVELASLPAARRLQGPRSPPWRGVATLLLVLGAALTTCYTRPSAGDTRQTSASCAVQMPRQIARGFRPPEDCSLCRGLAEVERVANVSPSSFQYRYVYTGKPVVVTDATRNWTAQSVFDFRFLKNVYQQHLQACHTQTGYDSLEDIFNSSSRRNLEPWHIGWKSCDGRATAILRQHYDRPYFLPPGDGSKLEWIYLGSPGYRETMHIDRVETPSWQAQLRGRKKWFLHPPPECYYQCQSLEVTLQPGDVIVLDTTRWHHETTVISEEMSIAIGAEFDIT